MAKILVICGHGAGDSGAVGNGYTEAERVRALGKRIKELGGSSVMLGDTSRNYYRDKGISKLTISKDYQIVELHMDSSDSSSAKGGHVIIKSGFSADEYDKKLVEMMKDIFPGRSSTIVGRSDLANPNRAAEKGYGYRLLECGFISNAGDVKIFNSRMDEIAKRILTSFSIGSSGYSKPAGGNSKPSGGSSSSAKLSVDGWWGVNTTKRLQQIFGTPVDGIVSDQYACYRSDNPGCDSGWEWMDRPTDSSLLIKAIQRKVGTRVDGHIGPDIIRGIQKWMGTTVDGCLSGPSDCVKALQKWANEQM